MNDFEKFAYDEVCKALADVRIAQALHASGIIKDRFLNSIPIILHELEYYDQIASQAAAANPPGLTKEFIAWVSSLGSPPV